MTTSPVEYALAFSTGLVAFALMLSGVSKFRHSSNTLAAMAALRVPAPFLRLGIARIVPCAEVALSLGLIVLPGVARQVAGLLTVIMLGTFTVLLIGALLRGDDVDCGCFGVLSAETRVTHWSVLRNIILLAASVSIVLLASGSAPFIVHLVQLDGVILLALSLAWSLTAIAVLVRALILARRTHAMPRPARPTPLSRPAPLSPMSIALGIDPARPGEVSLGDPIPQAELVTDLGQPRVLSDLGNGRPTLLVFLSVDCGNCRAVAEAVPSWQRAIPGIEIRIATSSDPDPLAAAYPHLAPLARFGSRAALSALGVQRSPAAVLLGGHQQPIVASPIAYGVEEIAGLVQSIVVAHR
ncbi:MauE/DoxX family redox-associated membrane protein [Microbacterium sp. NPDC058345]|uniref:MauE/DoxX family redox-associated membrane protein n=1 Tax=Microbacterium sp. NPDC058345 TaxID=3346455 RepID=UPI003658F4D3